MHALVAAAFAATTLAAAAPPATGALFDGKTLAGWEGNKKVWSVRDGAIVGGGRPLPHNEFLCTRASFGDFELRVTLKVTGDAKKNSGIQFRTRRVPGSTEVSGYQADAGAGYWGALYDESRRNRVLAAPAADLAGRLVREGDWNQYVVVARGPRITLTLNGQRTVDWTEGDATIARDGHICLQVHAGPHIEARFKDITVRPAPKESAMVPNSFHDVTAKTIDLQPQPLSAYKGKVLLVVNTASECGFTPQYAGLADLHRKYEGRGFAVLGFPSNDFGGQEPGSEAEIKTFCSTKFKVSFPLFAKVETKGPGQSPVYQFLTAKHGAPKWNFHKYVVGKDGQVVAEFPSSVKPDAPELTSAIEAALSK